jgi:hypothetical protein
LEFQGAVSGAEPDVLSLAARRSFVQRVIASSLFGSGRESAATLLSESNSNE